MSVDTYGSQGPKETPRSSPPGIKETIQTASKLAVETGDYLSFATVMDLYLGNPERFSTEEATDVLAVLHATLSEYPIILYKVGWDFMEVLLKYIDRFSEELVESLPNQKPFLLIMTLFSLLSEQGNPRELLVRACELMLSTESQANSKKLAALRLSQEDEEEKNSNTSISYENIDSVPTGFDRFDSVNTTRQENVKYCTLFEVIRFSLQRIETPYPSSFLLEAASTLLQVADDPNADLISTATYARRMYLLARDFTMPREEQVSPEELNRVRSILVNFVTHTTEIVLRKYNLKWSYKLYIQMRNRVALAPQTERDFVYNESDQTKRVSEVLSRLSQLLLSYDFDPEENYHLLTGRRISEDGRDLLTLPSTNPTKVEGCEVLADNYWSKQLLDGPSATGLALLKSQLHFDGTRENVPNWRLVAQYNLAYSDLFANSAGFRDLALYWPLWITSVSTPETFADLDENSKTLLHDWLRLLLAQITKFESAGERFVGGSVIARALRLLPPEEAYSFCISVMKTSKDSSEHYIIEESLKILLTGKVTNKNADHHAVAHGTSDRVFPLNDVQKKEVTKVAGEAIFLLKAQTHNIAFYYLNFLSVIPTDADELINVCNNLDDLADRYEAATGDKILPDCAQKLGMLRNASQQLRQQALASKETL